MTVPDERRERIAGDPYCEAVGIDLVALGEGHAVTELTVAERHLNFHGMAHGGAVYSLADAAFAAASNSHEADAVALETNTSYLERADAGDVLRATAEETHLAGQTAEYEVVVERVGEDGGDPERVASFRGRVYRFRD